MFLKRTSLAASLFKDNQLFALHFLKLFLNIRFDLLREHLVTILNQNIVDKSVIVPGFLPSLETPFNEVKFPRTRERKCFI